MPTAGWSRDLTVLDTGLPWIPPSPNLQDQESLFHYPGTVLFEGTALSVGRGTQAPFHQIGAPWLDAARLKTEAERAGLAGVRFAPVEFTPSGPGDQKFPGVPLQGLRLIMTDPARYDPLLTAVTLLSLVQRIHPDRIGFRAAGFDRLAGGPALREAIQAGQEPRAIVAAWEPALRAWERYRDSDLLYR